MSSFLLKEIVPQKKDPSRWNLVFIDFVLGIADPVKRDFSLSSGKRISEKKLSQVYQKEIVFRSREKALSLIGLRPRSEKEIRRRIKRYLEKTGSLSKDLPSFLIIKTEEAIEKVANQLKKKKLIDDEQFSLWWLEQRKTFRPRSSWEIRAELFRKGIKRETVEEALEQFGYSDLAMAKKLIKKKLCFWGSLGEREKRKKIILYLKRKGFSFESIKKAIDEIGLKR